MKDNYYIIDYIYRDTPTFEIYTKENFFKKIVSTPYPVYICESYEIKDGLFTFMGKKSYDIGYSIYKMTENEFKNSDYIKNVVLKNNQCFEITTSID